MISIRERKPLGKLIEQPDGKFLVKVRGQAPRVFDRREEAQRYFDRKAPRRYLAGLWVNQRLTWRTFDTRKKAEAYLSRSSTEINDGTYKDIRGSKAKITFEEYATRWRQKYLIAETGLKPSTLADKHYTLDKHLIGRFGASRVSALTNEQITTARADMLKDGQRPGNVNRIMRMLSTIFEDAI